MPVSPDRLQRRSPRCLRYSSLGTRRELPPSPSGVVELLVVMLECHRGVVAVGSEFVNQFVVRGSGLFVEGVAITEGPEPFDGAPGAAVAPSIVGQDDRAQPGQSELCLCRQRCGLEEADEVVGGVTLAGRIR